MTKQQRSSNLLLTMLRSQLSTEIRLLFFLHLICSPFSLNFEPEEEELKQAVVYSCCFNRVFSRTQQRSRCYYSPKKAKIPSKNCSITSCFIWEFILQKPIVLLGSSSLRYRTYRYSTLTDVHKQQKPVDRLYYSYYLK